MDNILQSPCEEGVGKTPVNPKVSKWSRKALQENKNWKWAQNP